MSCFYRAKTGGFWNSATNKAQPLQVYQGRCHIWDSARESIKKSMHSTFRVRTDFWFQNSRLFPDSFQNNNFFFQTQGYQIGDQ